MVAPVALDGVGLDHTTVAMLSELGMWLSLELDHVRAVSVLYAVDLDVDGASPVVPCGVLLAVDVDIGCAILVRKLVLLELVELDALGLVLGRWASNILRNTSACNRCGVGIRRSSSSYHCWGSHDEIMLTNVCDKKRTFGGEWEKKKTTMQSIGQISETETRG